MAQMTVQERTKNRLWFKWNIGDLRLMSVDEQLELLVISRRNGNKSNARRLEFALKHGIADHSRSGIGWPTEGNRRRA